MRLEVTVGNEVGLEVHEGVEVGFVIAIVEGVGELNHHGNFLRYLKHLASINNTLLQLGPFQVKQVGHGRIRNKLGIGAKFRTTKRRNALHQQFTRRLSIPHQQKRQRLIHLEAIPPVPIPSVRDDLGGRVEHPLHFFVIVPEGTDSRHFEVGVEFLSDAEFREGENGVVGFEGGFFGGGSGGVACDVHIGVEDFHVAGFVLRFGDGVVEVCENGFVMGFKGGEIGFRESVWGGV
mmetsp:Transcript_26204/g.47551  ORF Transcript_26204/g.47551 Transcript_26204/m.47551 type:complete len:235 (-) Transcript_26204:411-1115(-)